MSAKPFNISFDSEELLKDQIKRQGFVNFKKRLVGSFQANVNSVKRLLEMGVITEQESQLFFSRILKLIVDHICEVNKLKVVSPKTK